MNTIGNSTVNTQIMNVKKQEVKEESSGIQNPVDQAVISGQTHEEPQVIHREKSFLRKGIEQTAGFFGGIAGSVLMAPAGTLEGMAEANSSYKFSESNRATTGPVTFTTLAGSALAGVAVVALTGGMSLVAGAIGAGVGLAIGGLARILMGAADVPEKFTAAVDTAVDKAVADNPKGGSAAKKIANTIRDSSEGAAMGTVAGIKAGYDIGERAAEGITSGIISVGTGLASGVGHAIKNVFKKD